jgi:hypothetical protein
MNRPTARLAVTLLATLVLAASSPASAREEADAQPVRLEQARADYDAGHYRQAFDAFTRLADRGDPEAARIAVLMARYGTRLYGEEFSVTAAQARRWTSLVEGTNLANRQPAD